MVRAQFLLSYNYDGFSKRNCTAGLRINTALFSNSTRNIRYDEEAPSNPQFLNPSVGQRSRRPRVSVRSGE
jgi:hypothetical protein